MSAPQPVRPKAPLLIGLIGLIAVATIIVPVAALGLRVPWARISDYLGREEIRDMLLISVAAAFQSMLLALVMGLGLALWVQQLGRGSTIIRLLVYLPLAMPPVVGGLALTAALGRKATSPRFSTPWASTSPSPSQESWWRKPSWHCPLWW